MSNSPEIYAAAKRYLGLAEIPGKGSNPTLKRWIKQAADFLDDDDSETPWCGIFRGAIGLETGTGVPPEHYRAASWTKWGKSVDASRPELWRQGDTVVMSRTGGNHVTLVDRVEGNIVYCLGGNQGDSVKISGFAIGRVSHVRRG